MIRFEVLHTRLPRRQRWRWRIVAGNGRILAHSESYVRESDCRAAVDVVRCEARKAQVTPPHRLTGLS